MLFSQKNRPFVIATFHRSPRRFAPEANVVPIGWLKTGYLDVEKKS